ncbi:MAG TPA: hypothetical protein VIV35_02490 [Chitinophagaceae bacterium]
MKLFFLFILFSFGCSGQEYRLIEVNKESGLNKVRLGHTDYYIRIPNTFEVTENHGKEGQIGYGIDSKGTSSNSYGFIEIDLGQRTSDRSDDWGIIKEKVQSNLLGRQTTWKIYQTETGYWGAIALQGKIYARVSSKNKNEIDSLISIISTLSKN